MISSYCLGDFVMLTNCMTISELNQILKDHPNTIASKYIKERSKRFVFIKEGRLDTIIRIIMNEYTNYKHRLPADIANCNVIHLRLGDVVAGNTWHEIEKRPLGIDYLKEIAPEGKSYVIGKCFFASASSKNYDECIEKSNEYLSTCLNELNATHFDGGSADIDLLCALKSKCFVQGKGYYSKLIVEIRKKLGLKCIELNTFP